MSDEQAYTIANPIEWKGEYARLLDQTFLPSRTVFVDVRDIGQMWDAIKKMKIRGAPAIGIAAAYGFYLGLREVDDTQFSSFWIEVERLADYLNSARPTAVNLKWALDRIKRTIHANREKTIEDLKELVLKTAKTIHAEDLRICQAIGKVGQDVVEKGAQILTHCNTGSLATAKYGTALSVIYHAHESNKKIHVWVDETRPYLQGARLTTWELQQAGVPHTLITDSMAGFVMQQGKVDVVIVGADRVAKNGDTANKIGTYTLAVLAARHNIPFYVAVPMSTIDLQCETGAAIPIEVRDGKEITHIGGQRIAPPKTNTYNPAFDITPGELISAFITEKGIIKPPFESSLARAFK